MLSFRRLIVGVFGMLLSFSAVGCDFKEKAMDHDTQKLIDEAVEKAMAEFKVKDMEGSDKSFTDCLERNEAGAITGAYCNGSNVTTADVRSFGQQKPHSLTLRKCAVTDDLITACSELTSLEELSLWGSDITDTQMEKVSRMSNLKNLDVRQTLISDKGLVPIGTMSQLEGLELLGTNVTGKGMNSLRGLTKLKDLGLVQTKVDDPGMEAISSLKTLEELSLEDTNISNRGLEYVGRLTELKLLTIHNNEAVDEDGLRYLENLKKLETLYLCVPVTAKGVGSLKKMTALKHLYMGDAISDTPFNHQRLGRELPGVGVY